MTEQTNATEAARHDGSRTSSEQLGPLPDSDWTPGATLQYSADQMRAYAAQERAAERERIASHIRSAMGHAEAGYEDVAWRLLASLVGPNARLTAPATRAPKE